MPNKQAETVIRAYLHNVYATFGGSLIMIIDNGKEYNNDLFRKVAEEMVLKHQFSSKFNFSQEQNQNL